MPERPIPGFYSAFLEFENGTPASISHNGYGYFMGAEMVPWGDDRQRYDAAERAAIRQQLRSGTRAETAEKQALRIGGEQEYNIFRRNEPEAWVPEDMGMAIASLDRADVRQSRWGIYIHSDAGKQEIDILAGRQMGVGQRRAELEELYDAIVLNRPLWHDGRWGMATLEVCLAIMDSARQRKEIMLQHQVPVPNGYDEDFPLAGF
jgi:phthalate 4,5-cis-dihydrodiol dehydrogenase